MAKETNNDQAREELSRQVNHNNVMFNTKHEHGSNLIDHSGKYIFKKQPGDYEASKKAKKDFKAGKGNRAEFTKAFADSIEPRFNINLIIKA